MTRQWTGATHRLARAVAATFAVMLVFSAAPPAPASAAPRKVPINGAGSTWSSNAIDNWRRNVARSITVNYNASGSTDGRNRYKQGTVDFGVSEIPYGMADRFAGTDPAPTRSYAYMPIVAGGTAFMYNLRIGGRRVTNLRLSGDVIAKIFTGVIKRWNDPAIVADNPGLTMPARSIVPVVRQDGSGTSAQFTLWMSKEHGSVWDAYCRKFNKPSPCGLTSQYPYRSNEGFIGQTGSNGVSGYVSQGNAEGSITYVEYSYAKNARFPVVKVLNQAGYYTEPTASNVAVALTKARINTNQSSASYLTQILDDVYDFNDPRTYPLSSYSYMIIPVGAIDVDTMTLDKGYTLSLFAYYFLCEGQQQADTLGYSPLPRNLVDAGVRQVHRIPGAEKRNLDAAGCNNPTFRGGRNVLLDNAPRPLACDKKGSTQNPAGTAGAPEQTPVKASARCTTSGSGSGNGNNNGGANATTGPTPTATGGPGATTGPIDPDTGLPAGNGDGGGAGDGEQVAAVPVSLDGEGGWRLRHTVMVIAGLVFLGLILGPPLLANALRGRRNDGGPV
ncbi:phosphate ABC transporter substrate-binding protein PstS [Phytohabitans houttuyneae]|uniref:Phosphate ABC transporter substrate-binding protein PstS n=1 Tax=Phytohabitans houttuyneae TaxID=1076126 RepID=A0A6V8KY20_9ACTN|nr:phosphate ABC transporter substrate-binding protein PstS [Phytohabitans houttuyneae]GFJ85425.1 phosphate ABC transporter substrate-binding protein PstS [Phytohabitans houttuyneae]